MKTLGILNASSHILLTHLLTPSLPWQLRVWWEPDSTSHHLLHQLSRHLHLWPPEDFPMTN